MIETAGTFDAWGSNVLSGLVGGLFGAIFVVIGVRYAQRLNDERTAATARRAAGNGLMIQISNLRDDACSRSRGLIGDYPMWRMRNDLFVTHTVLGTYSSYDEANAFYDAVYAWREWARTHLAPGGIRSDDEGAGLTTYRQALRDYSESVIEVLRDHLEDEPLHFTRPAMPALAT